MLLASLAWYAMSILYTGMVVYHDQTDLVLTESLSLL